MAACHAIHIMGEGEKLPPKREWGKGKGFIKRGWGMMRGRRGYRNVLGNGMILRRGYPKVTNQT